MNRPVNRPVKTVLGFDPGAGGDSICAVQIFMPGDDTSGWDPAHPAWFVAPTPPRPAKRRTRSIDRTRSARWRAGSRRTRLLARRRGPCPPPRDPWAGWTDLGCISEDTVTTVFDETRAFDEAQLMELYRTVNR